MYILSNTHKMRVKASFMSGVVILVLTMIAHTMSYQDDMSLESEYCRLVKDKTWPDYNGNYLETCDEGDANEFTSISSDKEIS